MNVERGSVGMRRERELCSEIEGAKVTTPGAPLLALDYPEVIQRVKGLLMGRGASRGRSRFDGVHGVGFEDCVL